MQLLEMCPKCTTLWLEDQEVNLHCFMWSDSPAEDSEDYTMVRVNMGDKPVCCIAQAAMQETAHLPQFADKVEERQVIVDNAYVDDILVSHNEPQRLSEILQGLRPLTRHMLLS